MTAARHAFVAGRVQGVGFRWHTRSRARELGLAGWVRNLPDGRVEVFVEGPEAGVEALLAWLREGPSSARVERLEARPADPQGLLAFELAR